MDDWIEWYKHPIETTVIGSRQWRERTDTLNDVTIREYIHEREPTIVIATDGSIRDDVTAWGGIVWKDGQTIFEWSTGRHGRSSSYRAEGEALQDAFVWLVQNTTTSDYAMILTDSLSLVSRLQHGMVMGIWIPIIRRISARIELVYIPGHAGIKLNEKADKLAGKAEPFGDLVKTPSDVIRTIVEETIAHYGELPASWALERLRDRDIAWGDGSKIRLRGRQKNINTQLLMGLITPATLRTLLDMFEGRGPRRLQESLLS